MIYLFPIGGRGNRTQEHGKWKPFINVSGKYIFEHALSSIRFKCDDEIIFISARPVLPTWSEDVLKSVLDNIPVHRYEVIILDEVQSGPALTVYNGLKKSKFTRDTDNVHIINIDQIIEYDYFELSEPSGIIPVWFNSTGKSCYVEVEKNEPLVTRIREKEMISFLASSGVYIFNSIETLNKSIEWGINTPEVWKKSNDSTEELFIGPCMNYLIQNHKVWATATSKKIDLGSSNQIAKFNENRIW